MNLAIAGAGASGLKALQIIDDINADGGDINLVGWIDDNSNIWGRDYYGAEIIGGVDSIAELDIDGIVCVIGDPVNRHNMIQRLSKFGPEFPNLIHPSAQISDRAKLGTGNLISQSVVIQAGVQIGDFNSFNIAAVMGPLATIENYCTVNSQVMLASSSAVRSYCYVGMGAKVLQKCEVSEGTVVGANSFVNKPTEPWTTVVGTPARLASRRIPPELSSDNNDGHSMEHH